MCGPNSNRYVPFLALLLSVLALLSLAGKARAEEIRPYQMMTDEELLTELNKENSKLKTENETMRLNNLQLGVQSQLLTQSLDQMANLYNVQGNLLTGALKLSESYSEEAENAKTANRIETWFWRILGVLGAGYGLYQASR